MLNKLFGSQARVKILKIFLHHPEKRYYIRQLARDLKLQVNSARRELENLENFGLLVSNLSAVGDDDQAAPDITTFLEPVAKKDEGDRYDRSKQEKKYYQANTNFILFDEIRSLILKAQILYERDFIHKLQQIGKIKLLILTGIFVNDPHAQVDLLAVGRINKPRFLKLIKELEGELGQDFNFTLMSLPEFKYRRDMTDIFLYGILEGKKAVIIDEIGVS